MPRSNVTDDHRMEYLENIEKDSQLWRGSLLEIFTPPGSHVNENEKSR